jgi:hypothetical protein
MTWLAFVMTAAHTSALSIASPAHARRQALTLGIAGAYLLPARMQSQCNHGVTQ